MKKLLALCIALSLAGLIQAQEKQDSLDGRFRPEPGTIHAYVSDAMITQDIKVGEMAIESVIEIHSEETYKVIKANADKSRTLHLTFGRQWGKIDGFNGKIEFDSEGAKPTQPMVKELLKDAGKTYEIKVDTYGKILEVRPLLGEDKLGDRDEHKEEILQAVFAQFPKKPLSVGDSWKPVVPMHECKPGGCVELITSCKLAEMDDLKALITVHAVDTDKEGGKPAIRIDQILNLSRADGMLISMSAAGRMKIKVQGMDMDQKLELKMTRKENKSSK